MNFNTKQNLGQVKSLKNARRETDENKKVLGKRIAQARKEIANLRSQGDKCKNSAIAQTYYDLADEIERNLEK